MQQCRMASITGSLDPWIPGSLGWCIGWVGWHVNLFELTYPHATLWQYCQQLGRNNLFNRGAVACSLCGGVYT